MEYKDVKQSIDAAQTKPEFMERDEFIMPGVKKMLKHVKGERPIEILVYYNEKGEVDHAIEQFWLPSDQDMKSDKWVKS